MRAMLFSNPSRKPTSEMVPVLIAWAGATTYSFPVYRAIERTVQAKRIQCARHRRYGRPAGDRTLRRAGRGVVGSGGQLRTAAPPQPSATWLHPSTPDRAFQSQHFLVAAVR